MHNGVWALAHAPLSREQRRMAATLTAPNSFLGDYSAAFWIAGTMCAVAGLSFLTVGRSTFATAAAAPRLEPAVLQA